MKTRVLAALALVCVAALPLEAQDDAARSSGIKYHDGKPDGKDQVIGASKAIRFTLPKDGEKIGGIRIHASKYEHPKADNSIVINIRSADGTNVLSEQSASYSKFDVGEEKWVTVEFPKPVEVPKTFFLEIDDQASVYRGLIISWDSSSSGHSKYGHPKTGKMSGAGFKGDYMIEVLLAESSE